MVILYNIQSNSHPNDVQTIKETRRRDTPKMAIKIKMFADDLVYVVLLQAVSDYSREI